MIPANKKTRLTTTAYTLPAGTYECGYYAKGTTQTGLALYYPGHGGNGDISSVSYKSIEKNDWTLITYSFTLTEEKSGLELVIYVKNADDAYVIVDDFGCTVK